MHCLKKLCPVLIDILENHKLYQLQRILLIIPWQEKTKHDNPPIVSLEPAAGGLDTNAKEAFRFTSSMGKSRMSATQLLPSLH